MEFVAVKCHVQGWKIKKNNDNGGGKGPINTDLVKLEDGFDKDRKSDLLCCVDIVCAQHKVTVLW